MIASRLHRARRTLHQRLLFFLLTPLSVLLCLSLVADYQIALEPAQAAFDHALEDDAVALAARVQASGGQINVELPEVAETILRSDSADQEFLSAFGPDGRLLAGDADLLPDGLDAAHQLRLSDAMLRGQRIRKASYRLETPSGPVTVTVAETTHKRESTASRILAAMIVPNLLQILASLLLVYVGVRTGLMPLIHLGEDISRRASTDLSPLPRNEVPLEAEPLVNAMDRLMADLRDSASAQQAFLANAAHQLRTPLAGLQTQLELAVQELPPEHRARMERLCGATTRLGHLAHQLLSFARSSAEANIAHEFQPVDLARLVEEDVTHWVDEARRRHIDLGFEVAPARVRGSPWLLRELLANLLDNALKYNPPGGRVTVRCGPGETGPFLVVEDDGPGIPPAQRARVFERFYRPADSIGEGAGLGLAIVKEVAERHGAGVAIETPPGAAGTLLRITFPPCPAGSSRPLAPSSATLSAVAPGVPPGGSGDAPSDNSSGPI